MRKGFTLIELLIVMAILGILSTLGIGSFTTSRIKARDLARKSDLATVAKSLEAYVNDHRAYPLSNASGQIVCDLNTTCAWGSAFKDLNDTVYIAKLPDASQKYIYESDGRTYALYTHLENAQDPSIVTLDAGHAAKCGATTICNYKITSTNQ